jgi:hypothetical protein
MNPNPLQQPPEPAPATPSAGNAYVTDADSGLNVGRVVELSAG